MKRITVWQKAQAIICFLIIACLFVPLAMIAVNPGSAANALDGRLIIDPAIKSAVESISLWQRIVCAGMVLLGVICLVKMLSLVFSRGKRRRTGVSLQNAAEGELHISVPAIETLISQGIRDVQGLSDIRMKVTEFAEYITIELTFNARADIDIPQTLMELQTRIKDYVEDAAGVEVREVRLNVDKVVLSEGIQALPSGDTAKPAQDEDDGESAKAKHGLLNRRAAKAEQPAPQPEAKHEAKHEAKPEPAPEAKPTEKADAQPAEKADAKPAADAQPTVILADPAPDESQPAADAAKPE